MPHSDDDFGIDDDDTLFLAVATQVEHSQAGEVFQPSDRPTKRQRLSNDESGNEENESERGGSGTDESYYFAEELGDGRPKQSKHKIHIPRNPTFFEDKFLTQTQTGLDADPGAFRGAIWKKPAALNSSRLNPHSAKRSTTAGGGLAQSNGAQSLISNLFTRAPSLREDEKLARRLQAEEHDCSRRMTDVTRPDHAPAINTNHISDELRDLPPDAFTSSPNLTTGEHSVIELSSQTNERPLQLGQRAIRAPQNGLKQMTIFGQTATQDISTSQAAKKKHAWPLKSRDEKPTHHELDAEAMKTWIYPTNLGIIRDYQFNIVKRSLFYNTLVALPTGLGKTFIAATVMLNYHRWTTDAQIIFMAPTKPLIAQQMEACYQIVGIPRRDTVLMTGESTPALRSEEWRDKRVFFMTPQTVINDLKTGICDPKRIVLLVVDEAHKATGGYAYTEVVSFTRRFNDSFRVLALTATPGSKIESVQAVIDNLDIARVELRTEESIDIQRYTHDKLTETELFDPSDEQELIMEHATKALRPTLEKLNSQNAYWSKDPMSLTAFGLNQARSKWMQTDAGRKAPMPVKGMVNSAFTVLSQLAHGVGLLKYHGIGPFYSTVMAFQRTVDTGETKGKIAKAITESADWMKMMNLIRTWIATPDFIGHPKLEYLRQVVLNHFLDAGEGRHGPDVSPSATRIMIFASYRDSTEEICRVLKRSEPMIRPHHFVGQAGKAGSEGMNQKKQNEVVQDFKSGKYNTLVATSIGEEGLDIGDVDLIICYDSSASPIRMLQRIGRTGRKRVGRVQLLLMKGKEENDYIKAQHNYNYIQKSIANVDSYTYCEDRNRRILPADIDPVVDKRIIDIPPENTHPVDLNERGRRAKGKAKAKRPPKKFNMPDGVQTGFVRASKLGSDDEGIEAAAKAMHTPTRQTSTKSKAARKTVVRDPTPEPVIAQIPFLQDVLLSAVQERELARKYAHAADGDTDLIVAAPDVTALKRPFHDLGGTRFVQHGRFSENVHRMTCKLTAVSDAQIRAVGDLISDGTVEEYLCSPASAGCRFEQNNHDHVIDPVPKAAPTMTRAALLQTTPRHETYSNAEAQDVSCEVLSSAPPPARARRPTVATTAPKPAARQPPVRTPRIPAKGRGKKAKRTNNFEAAEGDISSPEPTPANMRIATQGIDLGSEDTSGEDEEDGEPDSELAEFVARSDEIIETFSSSLPHIAGDSSSAPRAVRRRLVRKPALSLIMSDDESVGEHVYDMSSSQAQVDEQISNEMHKARGRLRRVVEDDEEESEIDAD